MTDRSAPQMLACPSCAHPIPAGRPANGYAIALCGHCALLAVVQSGPYGLMIRKPTQTEYDLAIGREDVQRLVAALTDRRQGRA